MPKMKVYTTIEAFYPYRSGSGNHAYMMCKVLEKKGVRAPILTSTSGAEKEPAHEKMDGVEVFRFPIVWKFMKYFYTPKLKKMLLDKVTDDDIICTHAYRSYQTEIAYKVAKKKNVPFMMHNHGCLIAYRTIVKGWKKIPYIVYDVFNKNVALKADIIVVNSRQEVGEVVEFGVDRKKVRIIPFCVDADKYTPLEKDGKILTVLWVGRITKDRNIEVVLKALKLLKKQKIKLKIVGNEYKRTETQVEPEIPRLKKIASELGISDKIEFIPWTEERALLELKKADIFVYTSLWENFGQSILEAAAAGLPLICTRVGVALDLIEKGKTGYLVGFNNPKEIAAGIISFKDEKRRANATALLREKVKKEFNVDYIVESYLKIFESMKRKKQKE